MPIYEYMCTTCGQEFEALQKFTDAPLTTCTCGESGRVERKLSLSAFQLKGSGWYKDLYSGGKAEGNGANGNGNGNGAKTEGAGDGKAEAKTDKTEKAAGSGAGESGKSNAKSGGATPAGSA